MSLAFGHDLAAENLRMDGDEGAARIEEGRRDICIRAIERRGMRWRAK